MLNFQFSTEEASPERAAYISDGCKAIVTSWHRGHAFTANVVNGYQCKFEIIRKSVNFH